ncbi:hypothetical protein BDN67DRAFT_595544 [Paxillus ammoniavirescens]|nr:hypothetical protein BDN67DRAFT_595544 [Paxillus ammoniavirescens]
MNEKERVGIKIIVEFDCLVLKGTRGRCRACRAFSDPDNQAPSRPESPPLGGRGSRVPSPERHLTMASTTIPSISGPNESSVHDDQTSRSLPGLSSMQMKPLTSITSPGWLPLRPNSRCTISRSPRSPIAWAQSRARPPLTDGYGSTYAIHWLRCSTRTRKCAVASRIHGDAQKS